MKTHATVMTYAEMEAAFEGEWVLIGEPDLTPMNEVIRGAVLAHDEEKEAVYRALWRLQEIDSAPSHWAVWYFGEIPDDIEILI